MTKKDIVLVVKNCDLELLEIIAEAIRKYNEVKRNV